MDNLCEKSGTQENNAASVNQAVGIIPEAKTENAARNQYSVNAKAHQNEQNTYPQQSMNGEQAVKKPVNKNPLVIGGVLAVFVIVLIILFALRSDSGYEEPLESMARVVEESDGGAYEDMMYDWGSPAFSYAVRESFGNDILWDTALYSKLEDFFDEYYDYYYEYNYDYDDLAQKIHDSAVDEYGSKLEITCEVVNKDKLERSNISYLNNLVESFDLGNEYLIKDGYNLDVKVTISSSEDIDKDIIELTAVKTSEGWYLLNDPFMELGIN